MEVRCSQPEESTDERDRQVDVVGKLTYRRDRTTGSVVFSYFGPQYLLVARQEDPSGANLSSWFDPEDVVRTEVLPYGGDNNDWGTFGVYEILDRKEMSKKVAFELAFDPKYRSMSGLEVGAAKLDFPISSGSTEGILPDLSTQPRNCGVYSMAHSRDGSTLHFLVDTVIPRAWVKRMTDFLDKCAQERGIDPDLAGNDLLFNT